MNVKTQMNVKTFVVRVVKAENYETVLEILDKQVNDFLSTFEDRNLVIVSDTAIQDTLYPPIKNGDFPRLARRVVFKTIYRT